MSLNQQIFKEKHFFMNAALNNCVGIGQPEFKLTVIVFCKNNIATVTVICNLFFSFSQYKKHTNIHVIYLYIRYINCIFVSIKMPQNNLTPVAKKRKNKRTFYCKTVNWGFSPLVSYCIQN